VGDASLFWVRDGKLHASFPVVAADQFGSAPLLIRSNAGYKTLALIAAGVCRPGDRFLLATDAVAGRLFKSMASGLCPDWDAFESIDETAWRQDLDSLRRTNEMVNDDCTLIALRVRGNEPLPEPEPSRTDFQPVTAAENETESVPESAPQSAEPVEVPPTPESEESTTRDSFGEPGQSPV
jgi:hypothetical protein